MRTTPLARLPRWPVLIGAGAVATYQLSFFAAVADTGVAVGTTEVNLNLVANRFLGLPRE